MLHAEVQRDGFSAVDLSQIQKLLAIATRHDFRIVRGAIVYNDNLVSRPSLGE
ncbi:MAG: hypothetical protein PF501_11935 [Salinisphaera sp.]|nr:hypothetical protein [Salinisphaera sp.]